MRWSAQQLRQYHQEGFLLSPNLLSVEEVAALNTDVPLLLTDDDSGMHREREHSGAVRQVYNSHRHVPTFRKLVRHPKIVEPVQQILKNSFYVWHSKLNVKEAFEGTVWLWHQDYGYWIYDGVDSKLMSVMIFLDPATLHNGCLMVISGSHLWGRQEHYSDTTTTSYKQWCIQKSVLKEKVRETEIRQITGKPGDVLFFDCNLVHGSNHNLSPIPRKSLIIAYNDIDNTPRSVENPRPDWVVSRVFEEISWSEEA